MRAVKGEKVEWNGTMVDARYHSRDETIVNWLGITEEEMQVLGFKHRRCIRENDLSKARKLVMLEIVDQQSHGHSQHLR
jgi:hypothetical protein